MIPMPLTGVGRESPRHGIALSVRRTRGTLREAFAVRLEKMVKLLGQFLAIVTMMASVINAQCVVSCAFQSGTPSPAPQASRVVSNRAEHTCCKHQGSPKQKQQKDDASCPHRILTNEARLENKSGSFNSVAAVVVALSGDQYGPPVAETYLDLLTPPDSLGLSRLSSISILRV